MTVSLNQGVKLL